MVLLVAARRCVSQALPVTRGFLAAVDVARLSKASDGVRAALSWFAKGRVVRPVLPLAQGGLLYDIHCNVSEEFFQTYASSNASHPLDPKKLPLYTKVSNGVYEEAAVEVELGGDACAMRVVRHTNIGFYHPRYGNSRELILNDLTVLFSSTRKEAESLLDFLIDMEDQFRREHKLTVFTPVELSAHTIFQVVQGPVAENTVLLPEHLDRPNSAYQATVHYRGSDRFGTPFHKVVFKSEDGTKVEAGSGFFVSNKVLHCVQAARSIEDGSRQSSTSIAFVFAVKPGWAIKA